MGCGDRSVALNKQHFTCSRKLFARHNQTQTKRKPRCWSIIWCGPHSHNTHSSQGASELHIFEDNEAVIKMIIKGRSPTTRHVSRTQRELRSIGYLTELTWTPRSKSNLLTSRVNLLTCWQKGVSHVMSGTISFVCWISWISRCFPAVISTSQTEEPCQKEVKKVLPQKVRQWQNRDQWIWCHETSSVRRRILRKTWAIPTARWMLKVKTVVFQPSFGNWRETRAKTQRCIRKWGNRMILTLSALGNRRGEVSLRTRSAPGNRSEV